MLRVLSAVLMTVVSVLVPGTSRAVGEERCASGWMMAVDNGDFETGTYTSWCPEGPMSAGVDTGARWSRSGQANAYLQTASPHWNGMKQYLMMPSSEEYCIELVGWVRAMGRVDNGRIGVRLGRTAAVVREQPFSAPEGVYQQIGLKFRGTMSEVTFYIGYYSAAEWSRLMVDDIQLFPRYSLPTEPCA